MSRKSNIRKSFLQMGSALQAVALLGAGAVTVGLGATAAVAQDYTNVTASGRVVGTDGEAIAGATVTITSNRQGFSRSAVTDSSGGYRILQVPAGTYSFTVEADGYEAFADDGINLSLDRAANQFALVAVGSSSEIVVTAGRIEVVDFERTTTGAVIQLGELAQRIPVARDISDVVQLSPGTTAGDTAFGNLPNISGASVAENQFYINGLNITNFRTGLGSVAIPFDFYETVEIKNGGFQAEFGRATGGIVNAVTKSGSNEFHGGVLFNWQPDALSENRRNTIFEDNDAREFDRTDVVATLSGPIIKDRLFFSALYNHRNSTSRRGFVSLLSSSVVDPAQVQGTSYQIDRNDDPFWAVKIDAIPLDGHKFEFTYFDSSNATRRSIFGTPASGTRYDPVTNNPGPFASGVVFRQGGENYVARYTGELTNWLTISAAYGRNKDRDTEESSTPDLPSIIDERDGSPEQIGNPRANSDRSSDRRTFYRADADVTFDILGSHHIRFGYDRENLRTDIFTQSNGIGQVTLSTGSASDPFGFTSGEYALVRTFQNGGTFRSRNEAYYIQDNWSLLDNRLSLQLGLRNDRFTNFTGGGVAYYKSGNQWGPRLGFSADVFGDGSTKFYGSFGRYFLPIGANTNNRLGGAETDYDTFFALNGVGADGQLDLGVQLTPTAPGAGPCLTGGGVCITRSDGEPAIPTSLVSQSLKSQSLDEYIIGAERRLGSRVRVGLYYTHRDLNESLEDAAIDAAIRGYCDDNNLNGANADGETCQTIFNGTHQYVLLNPGAGARVVLSDLINGESTNRTVDFSAEDLGIPRAVRKYRAVTLTAEREFDGVWSLAGSYTWSTLRGNTEGGVRSDNGQTDVGLTVDFDLPGITDGTFGFSPNHRRHNFKLYGSYAPTDWLTLGFNAKVTSPRKFGCIGAVPASRDPDAAAFYGANGTYCNLNTDGSVRTAPAAPGEVLPPREIVRRGTAFESDWFTTLDLDARVELPTDTFKAFFRVSVENVFNSRAELDFEERGTFNNGSPRATYGAVSGYQDPRTFRLQLGVNF